MPSPEVPVDPPLPLEAPPEIPPGIPPGIPRGGYRLTRWIFLRFLGLIYLVAFVSLGVQVKGLVGENGILPAGQFLEAAEKSLGSNAHWYLPTLAWLDSSDAFLQLLSWGGAGLSLLLVRGYLQVPVLIALWTFYLSLVVAGQTFLSFQWDILLLETGFLAIFFAPLQVLPGLSREGAPSTLKLWLLRALLFRLMFASGVVKLTAHDPTWWNLTALDYHYWTQPLPNPIAWYAHQLPEWCQKISILGMFFIELVVPFFIFTPRRIRFVAAGLLLFFQGLILLTGNYTFFNWLTIALCLTLFDDAFFGRLLPRKLAEKIPRGGKPARKRLWMRSLAAVFAAAMIFLGLIELLRAFEREVPELERLTRILEPIQPLHIVNSYGLFRVMTKERPEIVVEGSNDGKTWSEYEFKYKPGDLRRPPCWVAPHQPRLDWQMWFAALGSRRQSPWFQNFMYRLLQGKPEVLWLLLKNPFPEAPPRYIRATLYEYRFTDFAEKKAEGAWWRRERRSLFFPPSSLHPEAAKPEAGR